MKSPFADAAGPRGEKSIAAPQAAAAALRSARVIVVSTGCPASIGPEISLAAANKLRGSAAVLVGDVETLKLAAELAGVRRERLKPSSLIGDPGKARGLFLHQAGPVLSNAARRPGKPNATSGVAQLSYVDEAARLCQQLRAPLVTAAVSKAAIAHSGAPDAKTFRGHTEWLQTLDGASSVTMCFWTPKFSTSLVTTHLPLRRVPKAITQASVTSSIVHLAQLLLRLGVAAPALAVSSLNPHAGEDQLFGDEEAKSIVPGLKAAIKQLPRSVSIAGPIGAETAYRKAARGDFDGVVAMYHDQATIPTKLLSFGDAVNVTMGLSFTRTSVDHGTAYDIAWQGVADAAGMRAAMQLGVRLSR